MNFVIAQALWNCFDAFKKVVEAKRINERASLARWFEEVAKDARDARKNNDPRFRRPVMR